MAPISTVCRLAARLSARNLRHDATVRGFGTSSRCLVAQNFTMPALSPTMTEGNIAKWNVKEGDTFTAGDVLLEIETDKASMDVEAQDDGIVAKIIQGDGSKGIKVGTRIGILAEAGDDLSTLEISPEEPIAKSAAENPASEQQPEISSRVEDASKVEQHETPVTRIASSPVVEQKYPLLPSVQHLIRLHGLNHSAINKMIPSGPSNRLLKGDVLSYLGKVKATYPTELSSKIERLSHLDLSNIRIIEAKPAPTPPVVETQTETPDTLVDLEVPISFKQVRDVQERMKGALGVDMPDNLFVSRATNLANKNLPRPHSYTPSADELFNSVLGLQSSSKSTGANGKFCLSKSSSSSTPTPSSKSIKFDIIDLLSGKNNASLKSSDIKSNGTWNSTPDFQTFSLRVPKAEEDRAQIFLSRVKSVLESSPGSLIL
ncbi:hypothetical protein K3495_g1739 [Podosphaera aphanis]|nr:hypothetical protein K3495_g1739 [Podosphaera aphanis]